YNRTTNVRNNSTSQGRVSRTLSGLSANTTYHFRVVAQNTHGVERGQTRSFRTAGEEETGDVSGNISCDRSTVDSIRIAYSFSNGENVSLFRGSTRVNSWNQSSSSGTILDSNLRNNQSYTYFLRNGRSNNSSLIDSITCQTDTREEVINEDLSIRRYVRSLDDNGEWVKSLTVSPDELIAVYIDVKVEGNNNAYGVIIRDILPDGISYAGGLRVDRVPFKGDIQNGVNIGTILAGERRVIIFNARVESSESFQIGVTRLTGTAFASANKNSSSDTSIVSVVRGVVAGVATEIATGFTNNRFIDFLLLPLVLTLVIFLIFKKYFTIISGWMEEKRAVVLNRNSSKKLERIRKLAILKEKLN
ncbi:MAG: hypothetical protein LRZ94_00470, partial [Candidatus Pacebacteria bacterium]|nr:hypothetical protein [Candidatus Paceibacterota bacterium]